MRNSVRTGVVNSNNTITSRRLKRLGRLMLAAAPVAAAFFAGGKAFGQSQLTWAPGGADGSGSWDLLSPNWNPGGVDWANGDSAIFGSGGVAGTVTLGAPISTVSLTFNTVSSGDYLITGGTLTLMSGQSITSNVIDGVGPTISSDIAGTSGLTLLGPGTLELNGINTYTGATTIGTGTLVVGTTGNLGAITNALNIGTTTNAAGAVTSVGNLTISSNQTVGTVNVMNSSSGSDTLVLNNTSVLTDNGGFNVGFPTTTGTAQTSSLVVTGANGSLVVNGSMNIGGSGTSSSKALCTTNMAGLNSFTLNAGASGSLLIGDGGNIKSLLTLTNVSANSSSTITAGTTIIGQSGGNNANAGCALEFGKGTNVLDTNTLTIGQGKSSGVLGFLSGTSTGNLTIAPITGAGTNITIGDETSGTATGNTSALALAGHQANVTAGTVIVAEEGGATAGTPTAQVTFDTGTFAATTVEVGFNTSGAAAVNTVGSVTLGTSPTSTGTLQIGTSSTPGAFILGNDVNSSTLATAATATFDMLGGTANVFANITSPSTKGTTTSTIDLSGGTLNMEGNSIGTAASGNGGITVNLVPVASQTATIANLGGAGIDVGGLKMNGQGTLVLDGNNTYTGGTNVTSGTLQVGLPSDTAAQSTPIGAVSGAVTVGSTLTFASSQSLGVANAIGGSGVINQSGPGITTLSGSNSFTGNVNVTSGNLSVTGSLTAATTNLSGGVLSGTGYVGTVNHSGGTISPGTASNLQGALSVTALNFSGGTLAFTVGSSSSSVLDVTNATFNAVPSFSFSLSGAPAAGSTFTLVQSTNPIADNGNLASFPTSSVGRTTFTPFEQGGPGGTAIDVAVSGGPASLFWYNAGGTGDGMTWDVQNNQNWNNAGTSSEDVFYQNDNVTFTDTSNGHFNVTVAQPVTPGAVQFLNHSNAYTFSGASITSTGNLYEFGAADVSISNVWTFGIAYLANGPMTIASGGALISPTVYMSGPGNSLTVNSGGTLNAGLINMPAGAVLTIDSGGVLTGAPALTDNGSVSLTQASTTISNLTGSGALAVTGTLVDSGGGSFSGSITDDGTGSLSLTGGTLTLSGNNTYSGATSVSTGARLVLPSTGSLNSATALNAGGTVEVDMNTLAVSTIAGAGAVFLNDATLIVNNGGSFSGSITDGGVGASGAVIVVGGTLTLSGTNTYAGSTQVLAGALLKPIGNGALGASQSTVLVNVMSGATVDIGGNTTANTLNFGDDNFNIAGTGTNGQGALYNSSTVTQEDAYNYVNLTGNALIGGARADVGRNVTNGTLNLNGFTLTTNIVATSNPIFGILSNVTVNNGAIVVDTPATGNGGLDFERAANAGPGVNVTYEPNTSAQFYELAAGSGGGVTAQLTFMGGNFIGNGGTILSTLPASLKLDGNVTFEPLTSGVPNASGTFAMNVTGNVSDDGNSRGVTVQGLQSATNSFSLTLSGVNTWGGPTKINEGVVVLGSNTGLPTGTPLTLGSTPALNGQLDLAGNSATVGSLAVTGTGTADFITSSVAGGVLNYAGGTSGFSGALTGQLALSVNSGSLALSGNNSYSGGTTINGGLLQMANVNALGPASNSLTVNSGTLDLNGNGLTVGSLSGAGGTIDNVTAGGNVALNVNQSGTTSFAGNVQNSSGVVSLNLTGGELTLSGANSYSGATNVNAGELVAATSSALPATTTLTIGATSTASAHLAASHGTYVISGLSVTAGSTLDVGNSSLTVNYGATDPISTIQSYLADGNAAGWAGGEITSSSVVAGNTSQSALIYSVGYADGADGVVAGLSSGEIEILPTLAGDAKLQGNVNFGDFQLLAQNFGSSAGWDGGNFSYGSVVNFGDFQLLAQDFGSSASGLTAGEVASLNGFAAEYGEKLEANPSGIGYSLVAVPEPASIGLVAAAGFGLVSRRRRRKA